MSKELKEKEIDPILKDIHIILIDIVVDYIANSISVAINEIMKELKKND